ncbi:hypothetical protein [Gluconobacter roseus]|uniref:Uncharacterized protein n=1 Tax=Gluconobacter roseus NBRC 3990 TaxID=1307950 RepID=A0A4Y3M5N3_9PROT|nr:hypothetical protein [Gluconobacter roseus]KXV43629.1 hypothetical protein AD943_08335 [Gluconobacter roseus]GBR47254.1 hypothetical protein AA3990_1720 [Gluconobacter roseus NBRC 3990]GEB04622.1 hypothetical protein GRO01_21980 [Gluconobacter roseus NBRC 3990]GLP92243.1 hypothetical protein GCM10007871_02210 [Gluconobacter roseus NBRC 3990]
MMSLGTRPNRVRAAARPRGLEELEHMTVCLLLLAVGVVGFCWLACLNLEISADDLLSALGYQSGLEAPFQG